MQNVWQLSNINKPEHWPKKPWCRRNCIFLTQSKLVHWRSNPYFKVIVCAIHQSRGKTHFSVSSKWLINNHKAWKFVPSNIIKYQAAKSLEKCLIYIHLRWFKREPNFWVLAESGITTIQRKRIRNQLLAGKRIKHCGQMLEADSQKSFSSKVYNCVAYSFLAQIFEFNIESLVWGISSKKNKE